MQADPRRASFLAAAVARGFTYIGVLVLVAIASAAAAGAAQVWHTAQRQEKERELLFVGQQFRTALERYARNTPRNGPTAPLRLEDLLQDPRAPGVQRYLRRIYPDPITGSTDWGVAKDAGGGIRGVHSRSEDEPLKKANFARSDRRFEGAQRYSEWIFMPSDSSSVLPLEKKPLKESR